MSAPSSQFNHAGGGVIAASSGSLRSSADVIIIGAGFAGLSAASELIKNGFSCLILEANDRVGGRTESGFNALGERIDLGGQFYSDPMIEVAHLVERIGAKRIEAPNEGALIVQPPLEPEAIDQLLAGSQALHERMIATLADPSINPAQSLADWLAEQNDDPEAKATFRSQNQGLWCASVEDLLLSFVATCDARISEGALELQAFPSCTMHGLALLLGEELADHLRFGRRVSKITRMQTQNLVEVEQAGEHYYAPHIVLAVPPVMASRIEFEPALPEDLKRAVSAWKAGSVIKIMLRYQTAFWRDDGRCGTVMWRDPAGLYACATNEAAGAATLVLFVGGPIARIWSPKGEAEIQRLAIESLVKALGEQAASPQEFIMRDWCDDPFSGGAYNDVIVDPAALDAEQIMLEGLPELQFACSELSALFPGYVEGAIRRGKQVAAKLIAQMQEATA